MSGGEDEQRELESTAANERVGYCRPPLTTRFRPGQSGNPRGRPKGARNLSTVVAAALSERVAVNENGRRRRITKLEAAIKQLVNRAASGEARATHNCCWRLSKPMRRGRPSKTPIGSAKPMRSSWPS
jgi:hypothetical protein